jgi:hypothetical protein
MNFSITALAAPAPTGPATGSTQTTDRPTFTWTSVTGADRYDLWIDRLNANGSLAQGQQVRFIVAGGATTSYMLSIAQALTPGFNYRWWIGAVSLNGQATVWNSTAQTFTIPALAAPTPTFGTQSATSIPGPTGVGPNPTFTWTTTQASLTRWYDIWMDNVTTNTSQLIRVYIDGTQTSWTVGSATSSTVPPGNPAPHSVAALTPGNRYRWWIRAVSTNGTGGLWSGAFYFTA